MSSPPLGELGNIYVHRKRPTTGGRDVFFLSRFSPKTTELQILATDGWVEEEEIDGLRSSGGVLDVDIPSVRASCV